MSTYKLAKTLIEKGNYEYTDMMKKLDVFLLGERITIEQYEELVGVMDTKKTPVE